ncbi:MAG: flagellar export chaperone FlgN [Candidatus Sericytochromatia bacterium]
MAPDALSELLECLKLEASCLQELLVQLRLQQQALVAGDQTGMLAASHNVENLLKPMQAASEQRQSVAQAWESLEDAMNQSPDLRSRTQFKVCLQALRQGAIELRQLHQRNSTLIVQGLSWVDASLSTFIQLQQQGQPAVYGATGGEATDWNPERSIFDSNA